MRLDHQIQDWPGTVIGRHAAMVDTVGQLYKGLDGRFQQLTWLDVVAAGGVVMVAGLLGLHKTEASQSRWQLGSRLPAPSAIAPKVRIHRALV
jgi:putative exporter of polyketide antibiotics